MWSWVPRDSHPRLIALARASSDYKRQIRSFDEEGTRHQQTHGCLTVTEVWSWVPVGCLTPRQTGRLTIGRNIILTLTWAIVNHIQWGPRIVSDKQWVDSYWLSETRQLEPWVSRETAASRRGREHRSWGTYIVKRRNLATASEHKLRRLDVCCSGKSNAWIITCSYDL
jgi:hypothetical protein